MLIDLKAASLNYRDLLVVTGRYNPRLALPMVPLSDGAGVVAAVGAGVSEVKVGDRVLGCFAPRWTAGRPTAETIRPALGCPLDGTLREKMVLPETAVVKTPAHLTDEQGATLVCAGLTAWNALVEQAAVRPGQTVLCLGTGGVSVFALQIAKALGARVIVTSSSEEKLARARALGADELVNYKADPAWGKKVRELTGGQGVDVVVEVGGAGTLGQSLRAVKAGGTIALIGVLAGGETPDLTPVLMNQVRLQGVFVGHRQAFQDLCAAVSHTGLVPVVDRTFGFGEAPEALRALEGAGHFGKLCLSYGR